MTDGSRYVVATIDVIGQNIARGIFTVDVYEGPATDISHTGTAINRIQVAGKQGDRSVAAYIALITTAIHTAADLYLCRGHHA